MSECNYCRWQRYKAKGYRIATREEAQKEFGESGGGGGVVVVNKDGEFVAWFMELPERCCC